jgi:hypothetical protein
MADITTSADDPWARFRKPPPMQSAPGCASKSARLIGLWMNSDAGTLTVDPARGGSRLSEPIKASAALDPIRHWRMLLVYKDGLIELFRLNGLGTAFREPLT